MDNAYYPDGLEEDPTGISMEGDNINNEEELERFHHEENDTEDHEHFQVEEEEEERYNDILNSETYSTASSSFSSSRYPVSNHTLPNNNNNNRQQQQQQQSIRQRISLNHHSSFLNNSHTHNNTSNNTSTNISYPTNSNIHFLDPTVPNPNAGVADYFAILGMGENLILKHSQKQNTINNNTSSSLGSSGDSSSTTGNGELSENELNEQQQQDQFEEIQMVERFYREIVEVKIFSKTSSSSFINDNIDSCSDVRITTTDITETQQPKNNTPAAQLQHGFNFSKDNYAYSTQDGFRVLNQTIPLSFPQQQQTSHSQTTPSLGDIDVTQDSVDYIDDILQKPRWKRGQSFTANLNLVQGSLHSEIILYQNPKSNKLPKSPDNNSKRQGKKNFAHQFLFRDATSNKTISKTMSAEFEQGEDVIITSSERREDIHGESFRMTPSFHIGYRRRGADEANKPAIANLELLYARIPKQYTSQSTTRKASNKTNNLEEEMEVKNDNKIPNPQNIASTALEAGGNAVAMTRNLVQGAGMAARAGLGLFQRTSESGEATTLVETLRMYHPSTSSPTKTAQNNSNDNDIDGNEKAEPSLRYEEIILKELLDVPEGYDDLIIPDFYKNIHVPVFSNNNSNNKNDDESNKNNSIKSLKQELYQQQEKQTRSSSNSSLVGLKRTLLFPSSSAKNLLRKVKSKQIRDKYITNKEDELDNMDIEEDSDDGEGVEAYVGSLFRSPSTSPEKNIKYKGSPSPAAPSSETENMIEFPVNLSSHKQEKEDSSIEYIPIICIRYQRVGDEERFHEDTGIVDLAVSFLDWNANAILPSRDTFDVSEEKSDENDDMDDFDEDEDEEISFLSKTPWAIATTHGISSSLLFAKATSKSSSFGIPTLVSRRNLEFGFCDVPFTTSVLDRFPQKNYKRLPLPEEELPMFCYPRGCRLERALFRDAPLPTSYGFVVKNEQGDSIHVSCVSFMEPLTSSKIDQLNRISEKRRKTSLSHRWFCESQDRQASEDTMLTGFDQMTTFENKTICLISRYPFWTAFRRFLSHLHILSGSSSDLPLERYISHLLLFLPMPKPGGSPVVVPITTHSTPMVFELPPEKDLPLMDLPYKRLFACLDINSIVLIVLGCLALERKVILLSSHPSLVLDGCELLKSLLFPFELCAPYVPRLTQPFMSCLEFPGAIFVGIHDDGSPSGLASIVRNNPPEDSIILDLDTGKMDCDGDITEVIKQTWGVLPEGQRDVLIEELEALCKDANINPGQEPVDTQIDSAFDVTLDPSLVINNSTEISVETTLDDRAIRDAFVRFFCAVLGGYERYLVVPDMDFLVSGNEWFDSKRFLANANKERAPFLGALVTTQLFQSFIQRRTEASDVHCMLFDECLAEYHSSSQPYGRLGIDQNGTILTSESIIKEDTLYDLLVDQCATEQTTVVMADILDQEDPNFSFSDVDTTSTSRIQQSSISMNTTLLNNSYFPTNDYGEIVSSPCHEDLPENARYVYFCDGNPCFPQKLDTNLFSPKEPITLLNDKSDSNKAMLTRSERELEESERRRKLATSYRGLHNQRRCLWQFPKLMASHFLGAWLMCCPALIKTLKNQNQTRSLLRALGALRVLRIQKRIIPDEAAYRALIVACGRSHSDRRVELVRLFGFLRSDGIFPSAVTLGHYTRAIAEGFSKRSSTLGTESDYFQGNNVEATEDLGTKKTLPSIGEVEMALNALDESLDNLEHAGRRWHKNNNIETDQTPNTSSPQRPNDSNLANSDRTSISRLASLPKGYKKSYHYWSPLMCATSFAPLDRSSSGPYIEEEDFTFISLWSRATSCESCNYIPLDEEIMAGWDVSEKDLIGSSSPTSVVCPRCGAFITPMLGYQEMTLSEMGDMKPSKSHKHVDKEEENFPPHLSPFILKDGSNNFLTIDEDENENIQNCGFVDYLSPITLRVLLEEALDKLGENALERENLRNIDPRLFYNLWWYCLRFSLPFPLAIASDDDQVPDDDCSLFIPQDSKERKSYHHYCTFGSWDQSVALEGCKSGAKCIHTYLKTLHSIFNEETLDASEEEEVEKPTLFPSVCENTLLSHFNLQTFSQADWDHPDLSQILVTLVQACDKRDFIPVLNCALRCNIRRIEEAKKKSPKKDLSLKSWMKSGLKKTTRETIVTPSVELDCYRTLLYLAKYQCTTAFHVFFPTTIKACKSYHIWCPQNTLNVFDRFFREARDKISLQQQQQQNQQGTDTLHIQEVSDIALGFRSVFGHVL